MRQGITTKYHGPTNSRGSRVTATARNAKTWSDGTRDKALALSDGWDHAKGMDENHTRVAQLLAVKLGWSGLWIGGGQPGESGYQYVCVSARSRADVAELLEGTEGRDWFFVKAEKPAA